MSIYETPTAQVEQNGQKFARKGNKTLAVLIGFAVDFGLTIVGSTVATYLVAAMLLKQGVGADQLEQQVALYWPTVMGSPLGYGLMVFGTFTSFLGAYLAARFANDREYVIATVLALISIGFSLGMASPSEGAMHWALSGVGVAVIYLGAYTHVRAKRGGE
ncbi:hypothetical protein FT643_19395 [Ketobacter sp. MCCC 1A13808]|uniref:hypothetical protein n=1 Tax=Ketobacter sp. MCCC 1A13808 TaxID=2602738 RepID=UPI0012ECA5E3|nr:hypothetical protein [Ketobacter sp. MCCC 1A13808]MVF14307.1 hypothetical protein [Ketobacter sp. MCCC 1A13808]